MIVLGVGLSKTGTTSLHRALQLLNLKCIHHDQSRLNDILDGSNPNPDFRRYDDLDAVTDIPSAYFFHEILDAYPESKAILTIRDIDAWWKSLLYHWNTLHPLRKTSVFYRIGGVLGLKRWPGKAEDEYNMFRRHLRNYVYGSVVASEFLYKKKYIEHNERVQASVPAHRLLVMNITAGDGWDKLCPFLGMSIPSETFPHSHKSNYELKKHIVIAHPSHGEAPHP